MEHIFKIIVDTSIKFEGYCKCRRFYANIIRESSSKDEMNTLKDRIKKLWFNHTKSSEKMLLTKNI